MAERSVFCLLSSSSLWILILPNCYQNCMLSLSNGDGIQSMALKTSEHTASVNLTNEGNTFQERKFAVSEKMLMVVLPPMVSPPKSEERICSKM